MCFSNINQMKVHSKISLPSEIMEHFHRILLKIIDNQSIFLLYIYIFFFLRNIRNIIL